MSLDGLDNIVIHIAYDLVLDSEVTHLKRRGGRDKDYCDQKRPLWPEGTMRKQRSNSPLIGYAVLVSEAGGPPERIHIAYLSLVCINNPLKCAAFLMTLARELSSPDSPECGLNSALYWTDLILYWTPGTQVLPLPLLAVWPVSFRVPTCAMRIIVWSLCCLPH